MWQIYWSFYGELWEEELLLKLKILFTGNSHSFMEDRSLQNKSLIESTSQSFYFVSVEITHGRLREGSLQPRTISRVHVRKSQNTRESLVTSGHWYPVGKSFTLLSCSFSLSTSCDVSFFSLPLPSSKREEKRARESSSQKALKTAKFDSKLVLLFKFYVCPRPKERLRLFLHLGESTPWLYSSQQTVWLNKKLSCSFFPADSFKRCWHTFLHWGDNKVT